MTDVAQPRRSARRQRLITLGALVAIAALVGGGVVMKRAHDRAEVRQGVEQLALFLGCAARMGEVMPGASLVPGEPHRYSDGSWTLPETAVTPTGSSLWMCTMEGGATRVESLEWQAP